MAHDNNATERGAGTPAQLAWIGYSLFMGDGIVALELSDDLGPGSVLMDNTTVFGAKDALESWPPILEDWTVGPLSVDLRSLMDLLEALVLHERIVVDSGSRNYDLWPRLPWLYKYLGGSKDVLRERDLVRLTLERLQGATDSGLIGPSYEELPSALVMCALDTLRKMWESDDLSEVLGHLLGTEEIKALPTFYRNSATFIDLMYDSYGNVLTEPAQERLNEIGELLRFASLEATNFALFAFRGFFYQQMAQMADVSYVPHSWRSELISKALSQKQLSFIQYVQSLTGTLRTDLANQLNAEFGAAVVQGEFPVFASFIVSQSSSRVDLFRVAVDLRNTAAARAFRSWLREMEAGLASQSDLQRLASAQAELRELMSDLRREIGLLHEPEFKQNVTLKLGIPGVGSAEAPTSVTGSRPRWVRRFMHRRPHLVFLRDVVSSSVSVAPFSAAYHRLGAG